MCSSDLSAQSLAVRLALFVQRSFGQPNIGVAGSEFFPDATINVKRPKSNGDIRRKFPKNFQEAKGVADVADVDGLPRGTKEQVHEILILKKLTHHDFFRSDESEGELKGKLSQIAGP